MGEATGIQWTDRTWSPWHGCAKVSEGCRNCYADKGSRRNPGVLGVWGPRGTCVVTAEASWAKVRRWDREARERGERVRVFPSICDPFEEWSGPMVDAKGRPVRAEGEYGRHRHVALADGLASMNSVRVRFLRLIEETPNIDWLVLSKRARHMAEWLAWYSMQEDSPLPRNLWGGVSVEDQAAAKERIPFLLKIPLAVRFLSMEPLLGPVSLTTACLIPATGDHPDMVGYMVGPDDGKSLLEKTPAEALSKSGINWVIVGGESGSNARPMHPNWVRNIRDVCKRAGVAFHFKQHGEWLAGDFTQRDDPRRKAEKYLYVSYDGSTTGLNPETAPCSSCLMLRVGVKVAGRVIDGREWSEFPTLEVAHA